jgi:hypothetical protein
MSNMKRLFTIKNGFVFTLMFFTILLVASCGSSRRSVGIEEGWELLSERKVNFIKDKDEIEVKSRNQFTAIRFQVEEREIHLNGLKIIFQNGDKLEPALDEVISAGQRSRVIELGAEGRDIDKIEFKYRTTGNILKGRGNVLVLGKRYYPGY